MRACRRVFPVYKKEGISIGSLALTSIVYAARFFGKGFTGFLMEIVGRHWTIAFARRIAAGNSRTAKDLRKGDVCYRGSCRSNDTAIT